MRCWRRYVGVCARLCFYRLANGVIGYVLLLRALSGNCYIHEKAVAAWLLAALYLLHMTERVLLPVPVLQTSMRCNYGACCLREAAAIASLVPPNGHCTHSASAAGCLRLGLQHILLLVPQFHRLNDCALLVDRQRCQLVAKLVSSPVALRAESAQVWPKYSRTEATMSSPPHARHRKCQEL